MIKNLSEDIFFILSEFCDIESIFNLRVLNRTFSLTITELLKLKYINLINKIKSKSNMFHIREDDIKKLQNKNLPNEFHILLKLLEVYNYQNIIRYEAWFNNDRFNENDKPPTNSMYICNKYKLWYNGSRLNLINDKSNHKFINVLNRYIGLGHDYSLFNIKGTDRYYLDYQGGSNGYEYDDAINKITNLDANNIKTFKLEDAIDVLIPTH